MTPEGAIQSAILDWLAAKHVMAFRMNTGAVKTEKRFFRFGVPGMADILAFKAASYPAHGSAFIQTIQPVWIEVKTPKGRQSDEQKSFQKQVEASGHKYILARSLEDVEEVFR